MKKFDVLVYGPIFCDLIFTGLESLPVLGHEIFSKDFTLTIGGSAIVSHGLNRLGARVGLIADIGNDPISNLIWEILEDLKIDRTLIRKHAIPLRKLTLALSYPNDRAFVTYVDRINEPQNFTEIFKQTSAQHLHLCSLLTILDNSNVIQQAHASGLSVSMDPGWEESALAAPEFLKIIKELDIFLPNESEVCQIAGRDQPDRAAEFVFSQMLDGLLVVKQGAKGAVAYSKHSPQGYRTPALPVDPVDTTGAGDSFDAGFLFANLKNQDLKTCMKTGTICGSLSTNRIGGIAGFPTRKEVDNWLQKSPS